jgi:amidohydrolase
MLEIARLLQLKIQSIRRQIHINPELAYNEFQTSALIKNELEANGIDNHRQVAGTGIVADIGTTDPTIALRADMDALPIQEESSAAYASKKEGIMHACGHDAHVACLLGAAQIIANEKFKGRVRLIFQPSEETVDEEGKSGAVRIVEEGALNGVGAIMAMHVDASASPGTILINEGPKSASMDEFELIIEGVGCHGAYPHRGIDPIFISAQVLNYLYGIVPRYIDPLEKALISIGKVCAGRVANIIPSKVEISGTIRTFSDDVREKICNRIRSVSKLVDGLGGTCRLRFIDSIPMIRNDSDVVHIIEEVIREMLGKSALRYMKPEMGSEDFGVYLKDTPGAIFYLGAALKNQSHRIHHNPKFDIDDTVLYIGSAILAGCAIRWLHANQEDQPQDK